MILRNHFSPGAKLLFGTLVGALLTLITILIASQQPWYGMEFSYHSAAETNQPVTLLSLHHHDNHTATLPTRVISLTSQQGTFPISSFDAMEEPDLLENFSDLSHFLERQQTLYDQMRQGQLTLTLNGPDNSTETLSLSAQQSRAISSFPTSFWVQIITGLVGFIVGCWVLALRPRDWATRFFMLTGTGLMLSAFPAAIYSTRELALPGDLTMALLWINRIGSSGFGFALIGFFLVFPRRLVSARQLKWLGMGYVTWLSIEFINWRWQTISIVYPLIMVMSLVILALIIVQWRRSYHQPEAKAQLRWLGIVSLVTVSLFLISAGLPALLGIAPPISQGNAFGFFLVLYAGLALGLKRYRLFELDRWAYHILLWAIAGMLLIGLDLLFLALLSFQPHTSLMLSLLICGFLYLPIRNTLWTLLIGRKQPTSREVFNRIIEVALAPSQDTYRDRWKALLNDLFNPLRMERNLQYQLTKPELSDDGLTLKLPSILHKSVVELTLADKGRRLFTPSDLSLATDIIDTLTYISNNRNAWQQGAEKERARIAQDLHDDLGSRLLTGLHQNDISDVRDTISLAISDMRSIVRGLAGRSLSLEQALAELRQETQVRCRSASIALHWPPLLLDEQALLNYTTYRQLLSIVRELFSNLFRHAQASKVTVSTRFENGYLTIHIINDGQEFNGEGNRHGHGIGNLYRRAEQFNGTLIYTPQTQGTLTQLSIPIPEWVDELSERQKKESN